MRANIALLIFILQCIAFPLYASPVQDFVFIDVEGNSYSWEDIKGTPLVVNFGSHW